MRSLAPLNLENHNKFGGTHGWGTALNNISAQDKCPSLHRVLLNFTPQGSRPILGDQPYNQSNSY